MLVLTPEPADLDPALLAHTPPFAFPALALHSHAPSGSSRDGLSLLMTRTSAASGGIRMLCLSVCLRPSAHVAYMSPLLIGLT
jgi:hypothetical protein